MLVVVIIEQRLGAADAGGLHALLALLGDEGDGLTLLKGLEAVLLLRESVMSSGEMRSVSDMLSRSSVRVLQHGTPQHMQERQLLPQWRGSGRRGQRSRSRG